MESASLRYILGFLGFLAAIVFIIVLIFRLSGRNADQVVTDLAPTPRLVEMVDAGANFVFTEEGPIVAEEDHYKIRITVSSAGRRAEVIKGYQNTVVGQVNHANNTEAFRQFLSALDRAGFTTERETEFDSEAGVCSNGKRYIFESGSNGLVSKRWSSNCREKGSQGGDVNALTKLFEKQIPEYNTFLSQTRKTSGLRFN